MVTGKTTSHLRQQIWYLFKRKKGEKKKEHKEEIAKELFEYITLAGTDDI